MNALSPDRRRFLLNVASAIGYGLAISWLVILVTGPGARVFDADAYWLAGRHVLDGTPLYMPAQLDSVGAYFYPPIFAQLWAPFALLPQPAFEWLWRLFSFGCLVWLAGGWRNAGLWLLLPITLNEFVNPNVTLPVAAIGFAALRGRVWLLPISGLLKLGPFLLVPYLWLKERELRRPLVLSMLATAAVCLASVVIAPAAWSDYLRYMASQGGSTTVGLGLVAILPTAAADFALRVALAVVLIGLAVYARSDRMAYFAATIAIPTLWLTRLVPLLALPRVTGGRPLRIRLPKRLSSAGAAET